MKRTRPQLWLAFFTLIAVLFVAVVDVGRTSPGPLSAVHQRESELAGRRDCKECHGGWRQSMADACLDCHVVIEEQLEGDRGLHGVLAEEEARRCAACHSEHHGTGLALVNRQSFVRAGVPDPEAFDHALIDFVLDGAHAVLDCIQCHENASEAILPAGETRFIGLDRACASCHEDPHDDRRVVGCADCHGQETWDGLRALGHDEVLPLIGGHANVDCRTCHVDGDEHSLDAVGAGLAPGRRRACLDCHASPHAEEFVAGIGRLEATSAAASCVACHVAEHESFDRESIEVSPEQHAHSGFPLSAPHDRATCADCHAVDGTDFAARYPGRGADTCAACHEDPHAGQFDDSPLAAEGCLSCHERHAFEPSTFGDELHALTALALDGRHLEIGCHDCHTDPAPGSARMFRSTSPRCDACHEDAHGDFFGPEPEELSGPPHGSCSLCHLTSTFAELTEEGFDHHRWARFPLRGAHTQSACEVCHEPALEADATGRTFGRVAEVFGPYQGCVTCHEDPHGGLFERPGLPDRVEGHRGCRRCHEESSFRTFAGDFDHGLWTGFGLEGGHEEVACSACHAPLRSNDVLGRTSGRARGTGCADCHSDPHAGQFREQGVTACDRCHSSSAGFSMLVFDHETDSRFALGDAHAAVACTACHDTWTLAEGREVVRYRPLPTECVDCHGTHEGPKLRRGRRRGN